MSDETETVARQGHRVSGSREGKVSALPTRPLPWALRNEKFVRAMCMIGIYVFGAIFLISMLAVGVFTLISVALAVLFLASAAMVLALWALNRRRQ
jgi:hypothetical protein